MATALVLSGGGPLAVAWECGLAAGLARAGLALNSADFILGTSAGAIAGAQLAAGRNPESMVSPIIAETRCAASGRDATLPNHGGHEATGPARVVPHR